jgi:hypothetical protein
MNFKTTLALLFLAGAAVVLYLTGPTLPPRIDPAPKPVPVSSERGTRNALKGLTPSSLTRIEVRHGDRVTTLEKSGQAWTLPGRWPTRPEEVNGLLALLGSLHSRFQPIPIEADTDLSAYGLDRPALTVKVETDKNKYTLAFGEPPDVGAAERFAKPTYLRLDDRQEIVRLGPGLVAALDRPADYYQRRRLFPTERVAKTDEPDSMIDQLAGTGLVVSEKKQKGEKGEEKEGIHFALERRPDGWELQSPYRDRLDPRSRDALLRALPDVWAEQFVRPEAAAFPASLAVPGVGWALALDPALARKRLLDKTGLENPERTVEVRQPGGSVVLLIGKTAEVRTHKETRQPPPGLPVPPRPVEEEVKEEYRFAKLKDNDQIFEINAEKLKDVFVGLDKLRDAQVARFNSADATRLEIKQGGQDIVLVKDKDRWKLKQPLEADAEQNAVTDLLNKLSFLEAREKDVIDRPEDLAKYGLAKPEAEITITVEETVKGSGDAKTKKERKLALQVGKHDVSTKKIYVKDAAREYPRVSAVDDSLAPLVKRPAMAYRGKRLFDLLASDLDKISIQHAGKTLTLERAKPGGWRLTAPVSAEADGSKTGELASKLGTLEALEYVDEAPKPDALDALYGLGKEGLTVTLTPADKSKPARTLLVGKARGGKPGYFAKLADAPAVFAISNDLHAALEKDSLSYLPLHLWQLFPEDVAEVRVAREGQEEFKLTRTGTGWQIAGPFNATALPTQADRIAAEMAFPQVESYKAHETKDLAAYGLDRPYLRLTMTDKDKKEHALLIGKETENGGKARFAKRTDAPAIFVVGDKLLSAADHAALDLLDPVLARLDASQIERVRAKMGDNGLTLEKKGDNWQVLDTPAGPFVADPEALRAAKNVWAGLRAERWAAYGPKVDPAKFGLDRPTVTVTVTVRKPGAKPEMEEHTLELGGVVEGNGGRRYARLDKGPGVAVLGPAAVRDLSRTYLDFVNKTVLNLDAATVTTLQRHQGTDVLEVARKDDGWRLVKPADDRADDKILADLTRQLGELRARRIAAYPAKDLKAFGLDKPESIWTIRLMQDGKSAEHVLKLGKEADATGDRFAVVDGGPVVAVLPAELARRLLAGPIAFRDRTVARFDEADRAILERGPRKATFAKVDGTWKLTEPLTAEADHDLLDDFINALARLRADELVADKPSADDWKKYGLDRPEARWRLQAGNKDVLQLWIGNHEKSNGRCYARLADRDLVFLLDPALTAKALGEFRTRTVWTAPLDAVQVESLRYVRGNSSFSLEKSDGGWQAPSKPDAKINPATVSETLAALAGLKLERYAVDKDADLKLFGLAPPELLIEIGTRTGKRVLHVGRTEGDSKRYYARIPDPGRTDVFLLGENDAAVIVRDLMAFTRGPRHPVASDAGSVTPPR